MRKPSYRPILVFILILILILIGRQLITGFLVTQGIVSYTTHTLISTAVNILLGLIALYFIKIHALNSLAGTSFGKIEKRVWLLFPLVYLPLLNLLFMDPVASTNPWIELTLLIVYCLSIGFSEELSIRGFVQSYWITHFGNDKRTITIAVFGSALIFGLLHLIRFDKGLYGELSQVLFATFIGVMFGFLLLLTKRVYPLIGIHALIDFVAKLDTAGIPKTLENTSPTSFTNSIITTIVVLPCFFYACFLIRKIDFKEILSRQL